MSSIASTWARVDEVVLDFVVKSFYDPRLA